MKFVKKVQVGWLGGATDETFEMSKWSRTEHAQDLLAVQLEGETLWAWVLEEESIRTPTELHFQMLAGEGQLVDDSEYVTTIQKSVTGLCVHVFCRRTVIQK